MEDVLGVLRQWVGLGITILCARHIAPSFSWLKLPTITAYLIIGVFLGPHLMGLVDFEILEQTHFLNQMALAVIAFSAGSEINFQALKAQLKSIVHVTSALVFFPLLFGSLATYLLADSIPFMWHLGSSGRLAVAILLGAIMIARSPSSAMAIIKEMRATGPFTQTILGVTVLSDVAVISLFACSLVVSDALLSDGGLKLTRLGLLFLELALSFLVGVVFSRILEKVLATRWSARLKMFLIASIGLLVFMGNEQIQLISKEAGGSFTLEPLFICVVIGFLIANREKYRDEFLHLLHQLDPFIYLCFFTLVGAGLNLFALKELWPFALILFFVRLVAIILASAVGSWSSQSSIFHMKWGWMTYLTQAGIGMGLASSLSDVFPQFGAELATLIIALIVINQIMGPPLLKLALQWSGEAHPKAKKTEKGLLHEALIFGQDGQALALAQQLRGHHWKVKLIPFGVHDFGQQVPEDIPVQPIQEVSLEVLKNLGAGSCGAVVGMLPEGPNKRIMEICFENFGQANRIVLLKERLNQEFFNELDCLTVAPSTAIVSLLDHFVRAPSAASLLLGEQEHQDIYDAVVTCPYFSGQTLNDLDLPEGVMVISVVRNGKQLHVHGGVRFQLGDHLTMAGPFKILEEIASAIEKRD